MRNIVASLERVQQLRKVVIYLSGGYDFNPFSAERVRYHGETRSARGLPFNRMGATGVSASASDSASDSELTPCPAGAARDRSVADADADRAGGRVGGRATPTWTAKLGGLQRRQGGVFSNPSSRQNFQANNATGVV